MAYSTTSKYVQITSYLVMEYMYADQPNPESYNVTTGSTTVSYNKLINGIMDGPGGTASNNPQIFNQNQNYSTTHNTAQNSVVQVTENSFITLNPNYIIPYNDFNSKLTPTSNLPVNFSSNFSITYDTVRYHILAGYNLGNIDGLIMGIDFLDSDGSYVTFSQIFLDNGFSSEYILNPSPLTIGINSYDKYFEVKIPSLLYLNNQYIASPTPSLTPASLLSKSGKGFVVGSPMRIRAYQVLNTSLTSGYSTYGSNLISVLSLESEDPFSNIGAFIGPADTGDFFEFFATDNGGFIEDFILFQNSIGNQYYIQNEIRVFEQIGTALLQTSNFYTIQSNAYDIPNLYRPIIKNSGIASSFTLRYTMTLVNSVDQSRLIRTASYTYNNPAKYGTYIAPLQLQNLPQVQKIYNKVATETSISVPNSNPTPRVIIKYSNVFFERNLVNVTQTNLTVKGNDITTADASTQTEVSYGQGKAYITVSPFDSYYKFTFYKKGSAGDTQLVDLESSGTYYMVFINNSNQKISAPTIDNKNIANPAKGELAFKISETVATNVLQYTNRKFYITNRPPSSTDPNIILDQIPTGGAAKDALASKSTSVNDSVSDLVKAAQTSSPGIDSNILTISSNSVSVLYWGNWLKEGESIPSTTVGATASATGGTRTNTRFIPTTLISGASETALVDAKNTTIKNIPVQTTTTTTSSNFNSTSSTPVSSGATLTPAQLKSSIAATVKGFIADGWDTQDIINYFLIPGQLGNILYKGITKAEFISAVTGIFTDADMTLLRNTGNTRSGSFNGGSASRGGSTASQTGGDSGSSLA